MAGEPELVGVLGGTFDPVHLGHLYIAGEVARTFSLGRVLLVPCSSPPHKSASGITPALHRLAMLRLAVADRPFLEVDTLELDRGGVSYTVETLRALRARPDPIRPLFILGLDGLLQLVTWREYDALVAEFDFVVVDRPGLVLEDGPLDPGIAERIITNPAGGDPDGAPATAIRRTAGRIYHIGIPPFSASSREVRERVASGAPLTGLVPPSVARYIQCHRLYAKEEEH